MVCSIPNDVNAVNTFLFWWTLILLVAPRGTRFGSTNDFGSSGMTFFLQQRNVVIVACTQAPGFRAERNPRRSDASRGKTPRWPGVTCLCAVSKIVFFPHFGGTDIDVPPVPPRLRLCGRGKKKKTRGWCKKKNPINHPAHMAGLDLLCRRKTRRQRHKKVSGRICCGALRPRHFLPCFLPKPSTHFLTQCLRKNLSRRAVGSAFLCRIYVVCPEMVEFSWKWHVVCVQAANLDSGRNVPRSVFLGTKSWCGPCFATKA